MVRRMLGKCLRILMMRRMLGVVSVDLGNEEGSKGPGRQWSIYAVKRARSITSSKSLGIMLTISDEKFMM